MNAIEDQSVPNSPRFEDDERTDQDGRSEPLGPPPPGGNSAIKIVGIVGGAVVVFGLIICGLIYYAFYPAKKGLAQINDDLQKQTQILQADMQHDLENRKLEEQNGDKAQATKAANAFLQEIKGRRFDTAYEMTTEKYKSRVPKVKFRALITEFGKEIGRVIQFRPDLAAENVGDTFTFKETIIRNGLLKLTLALVKDDGKWKVDELAVEQQ